MSEDKYQCKMSIPTSAPLVKASFSFCQGKSNEEANVLKQAKAKEASFCFLTKLCHFAPPPKNMAELRMTYIAYLGLVGCNVALAES